jgi:hypothetical protein
MIYKIRFKNLIRIFIDLVFPFLVIVTILTIKISIELYV